MNKLNLKFSTIYKAAFKNSGFTVLFSGIISLCIILLYALCAFIYDAVNVEITLSTIELLIALIILSFLTGLILPFMYSFFACYHVLKSPDKDKVRVRSFFKTYMIGISRPIRLAVQNFRTILISFLFYTVIGFLGVLILSVYVTNSSGPLHEMYVELANLDYYAEDAVETMRNILINYEEALRIPTLVIEYFSLVFSIYFYLHSIAKSTLKYFFAIAVGSDGKTQALKASNYFFRRGMRGHHLEYHGYFYKIMWPTTVIYFGLFTFIYFFTSINMNLDLFIAALTSLVVPLVILTLFIPVLFEFHDYLLPRFEKYFFELANKDLKSTMSQLEGNATLTEEEKELKDSIKETMDEFDNLVNELDKNENENDEKDDTKED